LHLPINVGDSASSYLETEHTTIIALRRAIKRYNMKELEGLLFHSDGGGQFYSNVFLELTDDYDMINNMGKSCYENAMAESLNGVIKNKYLRFKNINSLADLKRELDHKVHLYNSSKPHSPLGRMSPELYEKNGYIQEAKQKRR
jgi:putative transposase